MEGRLTAHRVMAVKPSVKRWRADDKNANYTHRKKPMIQRADDNFMRQWKLLEAKITKKDDHAVGTCNGEENSSSSSSSSLSSSSIVEVVSPEKALRAAMLKTRFADTINRATQTLFPNKKSDQIQQEKNELKIRRERERKALEEIEKRVDLDNTVDTLQTWFGPTWYGGF